MARRSSLSSLWARSIRRNVKAAQQQVTQAVKKAVAQRREPPPGPGDWIAGSAIGLAGVRRFHLYRPPGVRRNQRLPLVVMLHGCAQTAKEFAQSTRMNRLAARERFLVLYPEQDLRANAQGCWNWHETRTGAAQAEAALILLAIDQACRLYPVDPRRVAIAGLSAGASMAALVAARHPERFCAVMMHSGVPPGSAVSTASALEAMRGRRTPVPLEASLHPLPPLLVVHGSVDPIVSSRNAAEAVMLWAQALDAAPGAARPVQRGSRRAATVLDFKHQGITRVTLCEVQGLGHAWSGGDARQRFSDAKGPDASTMLWAFVKKRLG